MNHHHFYNLYNPCVRFCVLKALPPQKKVIRRSESSHGSSHGWETCPTPRHLTFLLGSERKGTGCSQGVEAVEALGARDFFQTEELLRRREGAEDLRWITRKNEVCIDVVYAYIYIYYIYILCI